MKKILEWTDRPTGQKKAGSLPKGKYFIGDPCYIINDNDWFTFLDIQKEAGVPIFKWRGEKCFAMGTWGGDGTFPTYINGKRAKEDLFADAGMMSCIPFKNMENNPAKILKKMLEKFSDLDPWKVLGLDRGASKADIKRAFIKLIKQWHPDISKKKGSTEETKKILWAYAVLKSGKERKINFDKYDASDKDYYTAREDYEDLGIIHTFKNEIDISWDDGTFLIDDGKDYIYIVTGDNNPFDDEEEEEQRDDWGNVYVRGVGWVRDTDGEEEEEDLW